MKRTLFSIVSLCLFSFAAFAQTNKVEIQTEYGKIVLVLYDNTPKHRDNFIKLVNQHFYDSTLFHRVIPQFMIQGGDPDSKHAKPGQALGEGDVGYRIPAEINDSDYHKRGALGMARDNNPEKASSGCQFYIVVGKKFTDAELDNMEKRSGRKYTAAQREVYKTQGGTPHLDNGYTVWGEVIEGMDVVDKIDNEPRNGMDRPNKDIRMISVRMVEEHKAKKKRKKFLGIF